MGCSNENNCRYEASFVSVFFVSSYASVAIEISLGTQPIQSLRSLFQIS